MYVVVDFNFWPRSWKKKISDLYGIQTLKKLSLPGKIVSPFMVHSTFTVHLQVVDYSGYS